MIIMLKCYWSMRPTISVFHSVLTHFSSHWLVDKHAFWRLRTQKENCTFCMHFNPVMLKSVISNVPISHTHLLCRLLHYINTYNFARYLEIYYLKCTDISHLLSGADHRTICIPKHNFARLSGIWNKKTKTLSWNWGSVPTWTFL